jgi:outer membrane protein assembly factor BamB
MKKITLVLCLLFGSSLGFAEPGSIKWQFDVQGIVHSAPTVSPDGSTIYVGSESNHLWALNANGNRKWAYPFLAPVYASPAVSRDGATIYVTSSVNRRELLYAITDQGGLRWQFDPGCLRDACWVVFSTLKLDQTGTILFDLSWWIDQSFWVQDAAKIDSDGRNFYRRTGIVRRIGAPPQERLRLWEIAPDEKGGFISIADPGSPGQQYGTSPLNWNFRTNQYFLFDRFLQALSFPAIDTTRDIFYFGGADGILYAYRNTARSPFWRRTIGPDISKGAPAVGDDGMIYVGAANGNLYAVYPDATFKWVTHVSDVGIDKRPAVDNKNGIVYVVDQPGNVIAVDAETGKVLWKQMNVNATPASVGPDGTVYVGTADHTVIAFNGGK